MAFPGEERNVLSAVVSAAENATTELVAAVTGKRIIVVGGLLSASTATQAATFKSASTAISGAMALFPGLPFALSESDVGYMETVAGEALNVTLANVAGGGLAGVLRYILED